MIYLKKKGWGGKMHLLSCERTALDDPPSYQALVDRCLQNMSVPARRELLMHVFLIDLFLTL